MLVMAWPVTLILLLLSISAEAKKVSHPLTATELIRLAKEKLIENKDTSGAIRLFENGCRIARNTGDLEQMLQCSRDLMEFYCDSGKFDLAERLSNDFLALARNRNETRYEAWGLDFVGNVLFYRAAYADAFDAFSQSADLMHASKDILGEAVALKDKGIAQKYIYRPVEAIETLNSALQLFQQAGDRQGELSTLLNIALAYERLGFKRQALQTREKVLQLAHETNNRTAMYHALVGIGDIYLGSDSVEQAMESFQEALTIAEDIKTAPRYRAWLLSSVAWAHYRLGKISDALKVQEEVFRLSRLFGSVEQIGAGYRDLGDMYVDVDPQKALDYFKLSLDVRQKHDVPVRRFTYAGMANAYSRLGELNRSIEYFEKAIDEFESARSVLTSKQQRSAFLRDHQFIYQGFVESLLRRSETSGNALGDKERAFGVYEEAKARRLFETISSMTLHESFERHVDPITEHRVISNKISELQRMLMREDLNDSERKGLVEELNRNEIDLEILAAKIENGNLVPEANSLPKQNTLVRIQNSLDPETALIAYSVGVSSIQAFVVYHDGLSVEKLPVAADALNAGIQNYLDLLANSNDTGWQAIGERLGRELVSPILRHLNPAIKRLVIIPDGSLHYLPFETLIVPETPRFLIEDYEISYAPSATIFAQLSERKRPHARNGALIFANPALSSNILTSPHTSHSREMMRLLFEIGDWQIDPIPESENEARAVKNLTGPGSMIFTGVEATEQQLKSEALKDYQILHFATHGLVSTEIPEHSSLLLATEETGDAEDGLLQAREIYQLRNSPDLVVLSACKTANGQILKGEGLESLAQAFLYAGTRSVVGSLWDVNDKRSTELMQLFYENLNAGKTKSAALREAKLLIIKADRQTPPRYWGLFILIGEPKDSIITTSELAESGFWERLIISASTYFPPRH